MQTFHLYLLMMLSILILLLTYRHLNDIYQKQNYLEDLEDLAHLLMIQAILIMSLYTLLQQQFDMHWHQYYL